jgi:hypothetical protein
MLPLRFILSVPSFNNDFNPPKKFNDISSADENKYKHFTVEPLFKNYKKQNIYSSIEDSEVVIVFERNNAGLKKLSSLSE